IVFLHALFDAIEHDAVAWRRCDPPATAAVAAKQPTERADQQLTLTKDVAALLDGAMQGEESFDQVGIAEHIAREVRNLCNAQALGDLVQRALGQVERAVAPALAASHPAGMRLRRVEHE